ncbi:hypothetical protein STASHLEY_00530 [Brevundimonas phage vB_BpoS-StAshley]|nr:hypothetical protein STASHLEY_00530 [Brevundimonas phage vB_BpoS-StAshley]
MTAAINRNVPEEILELVVEHLLGNNKLHYHIVERINYDWADQIGKMTLSQREEFICQQQLLWYKDVLIQSALRL